ncbi:uncharacterized protein LOC132600636 isoform X2 [Lycium barbarum]|nr:uncharacterized protein LOC132600636 isoform X2 [Lycium barbarum]
MKGNVKQLNGKGEFSWETNHWTLIQQDVITSQRKLMRAHEQCSRGLSLYCAVLLKRCMNASDDPSAVCLNCSCYMSRKSNYVALPVVKGAGAAKGGFVKEAMKYVVMDDLVVKPVSVVSSITGLNKYFNVTDVAALDEEVVHFGKEEALKLLKSSFESKAVLTSVFLSPVKTEK